MIYEEIPVVEFFNRIDSEDKAVELAWKYKNESSTYSCPRCKMKKYYQHLKRPELRECRNCGFQHRLRVGTIFQNSKMPMLTWVRAIYLMMMGKRGISALELQRQLKIGSYQTSLTMLRRIRLALFERDQRYKLEGIIEMDGAFLGTKNNENQRPFLLAVETKSWIDEQGRKKDRAGFAKVSFAKENHENAKGFIEKNIRLTSEIRTDGSKAYLSEVEGVNIESRPMLGDSERLKVWLPWVHRFISNAKAWIVGTHHGVESKHFELYMAEYTYRFNRRHDYKRYFSRALFACLSSRGEPPTILSSKAA